MTLRVLVVDDERLARRRLRRLIGTDAQVVGEAADGASAVARIAATRPDVVLLDVQMPEFDGFGVVRAIAPPRPLIVFVTAHDDFAVEAFDIHAVDYLLKPVSRERVLAALRRARERLARPAGAEGAIGALLDHVERTRAVERLPVRSQGRIDLVEVSAIDWIEAADNYVILHSGRRTHLLRQPLARLEQELDRRQFVRIHRSTLVRIERIVRLDVALRGDYDVTLADGTRLTLSRTYRSNFERVLGRPMGS